jgi:hypothetical protein
MKASKFTLVTLKMNAILKTKVPVRENQLGQLTIEYRGRKPGFTEIAASPSQRQFRVLCPRLAVDTTHSPATTPGDKPSSLCKPLFLQACQPQPRRHLYRGESGDISVVV